MMEINKIGTKSVLLSIIIQLASMIGNSCMETPFSSNHAAVFVLTNIFELTYISFKY
jgi:hypothetical protein